MNNKNYIKVKNQSDLVRDKNNKAILNINDSEMIKYKKERELKLQISEIVKNHDMLKSEISEIKEILLQIIKK